MNATHHHPQPGPGTLRMMVDSLGWPLLMLRSDQTLLHSNRAAQTVLARGRPLTLSPKRRVMVTDGRRQRRFEAACEAVLDDAEPVLLHWAGAAAAGSHWASLTLLPDADEGQPALLLALSPETGDGSDLAAFALLHGLSDTEARVLQRLALGESSTSAAAGLGLSASTVRTHALGIRRKTGHHTLPELVHALATLPPIAPPQAPVGD